MIGRRYRRGLQVEWRGGPPVARFSATLDLRHPAFESIKLLNHARPTRPVSPDAPEPAQPVESLGRPRKLAGFFRHLLAVDLRLGRQIWTNQYRSGGCCSGNAACRSQRDARLQIRSGPRLVQGLAA